MAGWRLIIGWDYCFALLVMNAVRGRVVEVGVGLRVSLVGGGDGRGGYGWVVRLFSVIL